MRRLLALAALLLGLSPIAAEAQSSCQYIAYGAVLTAAQWNSCFQQKADQVVGGYLPLSGGTMTGELITAASATTSAGLNVIPGTAPTSPNNGDLWATGVGFYVQIGGATYNLLAGATGVTSLGNPGGNSSLTLAGTGSGPWTGAVTIKLNLGNANAWTAAQSVASASATAFAVGLNGATNPAFNVDASTASQVAGLDVIGDAHNGTVAVKVIDSSGNTNLTINALGSGTIGIGSVSTGGVTITPATNVIGALTLGTQQTTQGSLVLSNTAAGAFATTIKSSNSATASWTLTLPTTAGTNGYILSTNGSGVTSWIVNTGGTGCTVSGVTTGYVYNNGSSGCATSSTFTTNGSTDTETATLNLTNAGAGFNHSFSSSSNIYDIINNSGSGHVGLEIEGNSGGTQAILSLGGTLGTNVFYILTQGSSGGPIIFQTNSTNALQLDNNANVQVYNQFYSTAAVTVASAAGATLDDIAIKAETTIVTGTTTVTALSKSHFYRPTFTDSSSATLTTASTVTIDNSPNCTGSLTCTNQYALNVVAGTANFGGNVNLGVSSLIAGGNAMTFPSSAATLTQTVASGATAMATGAIASGACTSATTTTATGTATTDTVAATFNADPTATTGYSPATAGMLTIIAYPTSNTVNFKVCNNTGASITPGAVTINWRVTR